MTYQGAAYDLDLIKCRRAVVYRQVEGDLGSLTELAARARLSRSTVSRFFAGRPTSIGATLRILAALHLPFCEVVTAPITESQ